MFLYSGPPRQPPCPITVLVVTKPARRPVESERGSAGKRIPLTSRTRAPVTITHLKEMPASLWVEGKFREFVNVNLLPDHDHASCVDCLSVYFVMRHHRENELYRLHATFGIRPLPFFCVPATCHSRAEHHRCPSSATPSAPQHRTHWRTDQILLPCFASQVSVRWFGPGDVLCNSQSGQEQKKVARQRPFRRRATIHWREDYHRITSAVPNRGGTTSCDASSRARVHRLDVHRGLE